MATQGKVKGTLAATGRSDVLHPRGGSHDSKNMTLSLSGTWVGTVTLDRSDDNGATWYTVESYTANTEKNVEVISDYFNYSVNFTRTSGTVAYILAH